MLGNPKLEREILLLFVGFQSLKQDYVLVIEIYCSAFSFFLSLWGYKHFSAQIQLQFCAYGALLVLKGLYYDARDQTEICLLKGRSLTPIIFSKPILPFLQQHIFLYLF